MAKNTLRTYAPLMLIVAVACTRLAPHWPNFTPVMAVALAGGALFSNRLQSLAVALGSMLLSDLLLGIVVGSEYFMHSTQLWVYACVAATAILGHSMRSASTARIVLLGGTVSSVGFFLVTNFAVWLHGGFYPLTLDGLAACYAAGLAFYRDGGNFLVNGIVSTLLFTTVVIAAARAVTSPKTAPIRM